MSINVVSDGMGSWSYSFMEPFLKRTFPKTTITFDNQRPADLVVRSHFTHLERTPAYTCPYILWSGESYPVALLDSHEPLFEINSFYSNRPRSVYFPHLVAEIPKVARPSEDKAKAKKYCCSYAYSNPVLEREMLFRWMRTLEPTCYAFGRCSFTNDNPFVAPNEVRQQNSEAFSEFAFNVAMENKVAPGYLTEKIGHAFCSGSVPIYWGDTDTVSAFFNPATFLNVRDYASPVSAAEAAIEIWRDRQKLQRFLDAPLTLNSLLSDYEAIYTEYRPWQKPMVDTLRDALPDIS